MKVTIKRETKTIFHKLISALRGRRTEVHVGFPAGIADQETINKAVWNEFGTRGGASGGGWGGPVPERPFLRSAMRDNADKYKVAMRRSAAKVLTGEASPDTVMSHIGIQAAADVQKSIRTLSDPPNSPVTIARKGSSNPLINTGEMRQSVRHRVVKE